ncbi:MAG: hypothetical protein U0586_06290 [Candidatus Brocadiaceae bacterium]
MVNEITVTKENMETEEIEKDQYLVFTSKSQEFGIRRCGFMRFQRHWALRRFPIHRRTLKAS